MEAGPKVNRKAWTWVALLVLLAWSSVASKKPRSPEFILRARADLVDDIAKRHRLTPLRSLDGDHGKLFLVRRLDDDDLKAVDLDDDDLEDEVDDDTEVQAFEANQPADLPEAPQGGRLNQSTAAILETLPDRTPVGYFGAQVWRGYASQPVASTLGLATAHTAFRTGAQVIAVIDTGVDPDHVVAQGRPGTRF